MNIETLKALITNPAVTVAVVSFGRFGQLFRCIEIGQRGVLVERETIEELAADMATMGLARKPNFLERHPGPSFEELMARYPRR